MLKFGQGVAVPPNGIIAARDQRAVGDASVQPRHSPKSNCRSHVEPSITSGVVHEVRQRSAFGDPVAPSTMPGSSAPPYRVVTVKVEPDTEPVNQTPVRLAALKRSGPPTDAVRQNFAAEHQTVAPLPAPTVCVCVTLPRALTPMPTPSRAVIEQTRGRRSYSPFPDQKPRTLLERGAARLYAEPIASIDSVLSRNKICRTGGPRR